MRQYKSRPTTVAAYQLTDEMLFNHLIDGHELPEGLSMSGAHWHQGNRTVSECRVCVVTIQGERVSVKPGEWIVREPIGDGHYPIADEVFRAKYKT